MSFDNDDDADFDVDRNLVRVEHKGVQLVVDRELVPELQVQRGSLFQFIGEVTQFQARALSRSPPHPIPAHPPRCLQPQLQLRARVARIVDGLDLELYDEALQVRRAFEEEMAAAAAAAGGAAAAPDTAAPMQQ